MNLFNVTTKPRNSMVSYCVVGLIALAASFSATAGNTLLRTNEISVERFAASEPLTGDLVTLRVDVKRPCSFIAGTTINVDIEAFTVDILFHERSFGGICVPDTPSMIEVEGLTEVGVYTFNIHHYRDFEEPDEFDPRNLEGSFELVVASNILNIFPETPAEGSVQSGVGVVRGWACSAEKVEVQFDDNPRIRVAYGTARKDTQPLCGDDNNGYGLVLAWGALGIGAHRMKTYIDDVEISDVGFEVSVLNCTQN